MEENENTEVDGFTGEICSGPGLSGHKTIKEVQDMLQGKKRSLFRRITDRLTRPFKSKLHSPVLQNMPRRALTEYRDSGQISIKAEVSFTPDIFKQYVEMVLAEEGNDHERISVSAGEDGSKLAGKLAGKTILSVTPIAGRMPTAFGSETGYISFKPHRIVLIATAEATYTGKNLEDKKVYVELSQANHVMLTGAFSGSLNTFPNAPRSGYGVHGPVFGTQAIGVGLAWPTVNAGIPVSASFEVLESVLGCFVAPEGYDKTPRTITVKILMAMFGPQLR